MTVVVIAGDRKQDEFMHAADMFEPFKRLASIHRVTVTFKPDALRYPCKIVPLLKQAFEERGMIVVAAFVPGELSGAWIDINVKCISSGTNWVMFDQLLASLGYPERAIQPNK